MPNWCANRLEINGPVSPMQKVKALMCGEIEPLYQAAIQQSIKLFVAGCAGILKPTAWKPYTLYPDLLLHGRGEPVQANQAFTQWLDLFNSNVELDADNVKLIAELYARTGLSTLSWESLSVEQQQAVQTLWNKKYFDWSKGELCARKAPAQWWQELDEPSPGIQFDMRLIVPTKLAVEINGFNGELLPGIHSAYDFYIDTYGVKWPVAYDFKLLDESEHTDRASLTVEFDTPWSPPDNAVLLALSERYQCSVTHYFSEQGMGFCGMSEYESGELLCSTSDNLEHGEEDEEGFSEVIGPGYIIDHVPHYGG